ncbi:MAG TPA: hypothetical protein VER58_20385 [Thermoanaerobaculia bacterium]|nr:hypothetical protein [Thermoanaerobaculia bacterium]
MTKRLVLSVCLVLVIALAAYTQIPSRPYRNGSVWEITFIHTHAGMGNAYLTYLTTDWKREQEAAKQDGMILSYKVLTTESHTGADWDVMLMVEYKDLATMEANQAKQDALGQKLFGGDQKIEQGYRDRAAMRDVVGGRVAREIILEPKK